MEQPAMKAISDERLAELIERSDRLNRHGNLFDGETAIALRELQQLRKGVVVPREVVEFLTGEGTLHGCVFGEKPIGERGNFWWRKYLRTALGDV